MGCWVGRVVGCVLGCFEGWPVGEVGLADGWPVGCIVGVRSVK